MERFSSTTKKEKEWACMTDHFVLKNSNQKLPKPPQAWKTMVHHFSCSPASTVVVAETPEQPPSDSLSRMKIEFVLCDNI